MFIFVLKEIGKFILALVCVMISYFALATMFGGFISLVVWDLIVLKDIWMFWTTPTYFALRIIVWFLAIGFGFTAIYSDDGFLN